MQSECDHILSSNVIMNSHENYMHSCMVLYVMFILCNVCIQGDCHWAKWLLLSRIKGREYDASFFNARSILSRNNSVPSNNLGILGIEEIIRIVDDIAEGGGEMAALATLMFAPVPIQNCLSSGSVNRHYSSSAQCTLENLRPTLQHFPTLWRTLVAASFGHDITSNFLSPKAKNGQIFDS